jgi:hypothetical protein
MKSLNIVDRQGFWKAVGSRWPADGCKKDISFFEIKNELTDYLVKNKVKPKTFGHFGFVVRNNKDPIDFIKSFHSKDEVIFRTDWVNSFLLYVTRFTVNHTELEFLSPEGNSFFKDFLNQAGERLHHLAFETGNIKNALDCLKKGGATLVTEKALKGAHGLVAFIEPQISCKVYLELYQVK